MHARVTTLEGSPDKMDDATRHLQEQVLPQLQQMEGFKGFVALGDRQSGKLLGVALWESEEALRATEEAVSSVRSEAAEAADVGQGPMEMFGQTIEIQPPHPGVEESHYMLHIYFKPDGKVLFGTNPQTAFDPEGVCPEASSSSASALAETGGPLSLTSLAAMVLLIGTGVLAFGVLRRS